MSESQDVLYVRNDYRKLTELLFKDRRGIILGNPGIGKVGCKVFMYYTIFTQGGSIVSPVSSLIQPSDRIACSFLYALWVSRLGYYITLWQC